MREVRGEEGEGDGGEGVREVRGEEGEGDVGEGVREVRGEGGTVEGKNQVDTQFTLMYARMIRRVRGREGGE